MKLKKLGVLLLTLCMVLTLFPASFVYARSAQVKAQAASDWNINCEAQMEGMIRGQLSLKMSITNKGSSAAAPDGMTVHVLDCNNDDADLTYSGIILSYLTPKFVNGQRIVPIEPGETREFYVSCIDTTQKEAAGTAIPYKVQVRDENGNVVVEKKVNVTYENPDAVYKFVFSKADDAANTALDKITAVIGQTVKYNARLIMTLPNGTKKAVDPKSVFVEYGFFRGTGTYADITAETNEDGYIFSITGIKPTEPNRPDALQVVVTANVNRENLVDASLDLDVLSAEDADKRISKITISGISKKIAAGKKIKLTAKITPSDAANQELKWKSSNTKAATVTQSGLVTIKAGSGGKTVTITASAKDGSGQKAVYKIQSMKGEVKKVAVSGLKTVKAGKTLTLKAKVTASKGANTNLKWKSSNTKYAVVSSTGKVTAKKAGKGKTVTITAQATDGTGRKGTIKITIK